MIVQEIRKNHGVPLKLSWLCNHQEYLYKTKNIRPKHKFLTPIQILNASHY